MSSEPIQSGTSNASNTSLLCTIPFGDVRKNEYLMIKGRPCKIVDMSMSKAGHGYKVHAVGIDVLTGRKLEIIEKHTTQMEVPEVVRTDYTLDCVTDGFLRLVGQDGSTREDVELPLGDLWRDTMAAMAGGAEKSVVVTVISAMGEDTAFYSRTRGQD
ncbi:hypothetical protein B0H19DRAFT_156606 [Mycena capillaripes]|nr:hypothetical protein B0H19DRAFT_156606 [Mycena capillaripes]